MAVSHGGYSGQQCSSIVSSSAVLTYARAFSAVLVYSVGLTVVLAVLPVQGLTVHGATVGTISIASSLLRRRLDRFEHMHPDELPTVIEPILASRADYVQGSRFANGGRALRQRFTDITCGFRAYRLSMFRNPRVNLDQRWLDRYEANCTSISMRAASGSGL